MNKGSRSQSAARGIDGLRAPLAVVGIGASAGGLDALKDFFSAMPDESGMAFVVVQHLEPAHPSHMADILSKYTSFVVCQAEDNQTIEPNCVYTIPANKYLVIRSGCLWLSDPQERSGRRMPIDHFFRSLAEDQQTKAVCIVLSGSSGSDGTQGLRAVRNAGGMCMVQDPRTAQFAEMPQSAIDTGLADYVLPPGDMPGVLLAYARHDYVGSDNQTLLESPSDSSVLSAILKQLRVRSNSDYRGYKEGTVLRRIQRRMGLTQSIDMVGYLGLIQRDPSELIQLAKDMLIGVSSFFRDSEAFAELRVKVIDPLVEAKSPDSPVRVWVAGCSSGEEAYSISMLLLEALESAGKRNAVQVFASDVDEDALDVARVGLYPEAAVADVSAERLDRFFTRRNGHYQVGKQLRETVLFARQNLMADPPFSRMDVISCRNVLIYLQSAAQRKVMSIFSFSLNVGGYLFLGKSETIGERADLFEIVSKSKRLYRLARANRQAADLPVFAGTPRFAEAAKERGDAPPSAAELADLNQRVLLGHFDAAVVIIDAKGRILHFFGQVEKYFMHPAGQASLNVLDLTSGSLAAKLRKSIGRVIQSDKCEVLSQVALSRKSAGKHVNVTIMPLPGRARADKLIAIILEDARGSAGTIAGAHPTGEDESVIAQLEGEIKALRSELDEGSEEHELASEELKAANEEMMSMNEELQSANEELETSKEELQSINEELNTVNSQLTEKVGELTDRTNDLSNLAGATEIATVFIDTQLRIRQFTPRATELLNLIPGDVGRPLAHITQNFDGKSLSDVAAGVIKDLVPIEREVRIPDGRWYIMRVLPYRTLDNHIDGAVVTFADITRLKRLEDSLQRSKAYAESIIATVREPLLVLDSDLRVVSANSSFYQTFSVVEKSTVGAFLYHLGDGQWNIPELRRLLEGITPEKSECKDFQVEYNLPRLGPRIMFLSARRIEPAEGRRALILLAIEDVTEREQARRQIESLATELEKRVLERTSELAQAIAELQREVHERLAAEARIQAMNEALSHRANQLAALSTELTLAEQRERNRLAQILHDGVQQLIVGTKMGLGMLCHSYKADSKLVQSLEEFGAYLGEALQLTRTLASELSPSILKNVGLAAAVQWLGEEMKRIHGLEVSVSTDSEIPVDAVGIVEMLFQAVRELLFNVVKHAGVKSAAVQIRHLTEDHIQIEIVDEGIGFDPELPGSRVSGTGLGLFGFQERLAQMGGGMVVKSAPGHGTRVVMDATIRPSSSKSQKG